jgi:hypothetical protein
VNRFAILQSLSGKLEIVELAIDNDPIDVAKSRNAYLIGITLTKSRADFLLRRESGKAGSTT